MRTCTIENPLVEVAWIFRLRMAHSLSEINEINEISEGNDVRYCYR